MFSYCFDYSIYIFYLHFNKVDMKKRKQKRLKTNLHHVPPRHPDKFPRLIRMSVKRHDAYHLLVGNPKNFEDCCRVIWRDFWAKDGEEFPYT